MTTMKKKHKNQKQGHFGDDGANEPNFDPIEDSPSYGAGDEGTDPDIDMGAGLLPFGDPVVDFGGEFYPFAGPAPVLGCEYGPSGAGLKK